MLDDKISFWISSNPKQTLNCCSIPPPSRLLCLIRNSLFNPNNFHRYVSLIKGGQTLLRGNVKSSIKIRNGKKLLSLCNKRFWDKRLLFVRTIAIFLVILFAWKIWRDFQPSVDIRISSWTSPSPSPKSKFSQVLNSKETNLPLDPYIVRAQINFTFQIPGLSLSTLNIVMHI